MVGEEFDGHVDSFASGGGDVNSVASVVIAGWADVPAVNPMGRPSTAAATGFEPQYTTTRRGEGGGVEVECAVEVGFCGQLRVEVGAAEKVEGEEGVGDESAP